MLFRIVKIGMQRQESLHAHGGAGCEPKDKQPKRLHVQIIQKDRKSGLGHDILPSTKGKAVDHCIELFIALGRRQTKLDICGSLSLPLSTNSVCAALRLSR